MHGVYDARGELIYQSDSDLMALAVALQQPTHKLTTVLLDGVREVVLTPVLPGGQQRAETAIEFDARMRMGGVTKLLP